MSMMLSRRVWRLMMKRRREEWPGTERGQGRGEREHWRLESWRMENTVLVLSLRGLIIGGEGREGMRRKDEAKGREEMELLSWMNMGQLLEGWRMGRLVEIMREMFLEADPDSGSLNLVGFRQLKLSLTKIAVN